MKLDKSIPFLSGLEDDELDKCFELMNKLPSKDCINIPDTLIIEHEGHYHLIKARGGICEKPYDIEFNDYTIEEVRKDCNPKTGYTIPKGFERQNVLIRI